MTVHCKQCGHQWEPHMPMPVELVRATKIMAGVVAAGCPQCGAYGDNVLVGPTPRKVKKK